MTLSKFAALIALIVAATCVSIVGISAQTTPYQHFEKAVIVDLTDKTEVETTALQVLREETQDRTGIRLTTGSEAGRPQIVLATRASIARHPDFAKLLQDTENQQKDGFSIRLTRTGTQAPTLLITGNDARGLLFGVGYVLKKSLLKRNIIQIPESISTETSPAVAIRGHQLGYRPKVNSYDGFTVAMWEQYIRDLAIFGTNAVELMPPNTDDDAHSPMFPLPQKEMLVEMSTLLKKYGMDVWMWYPLMYGNYAKADVARRSLQENDSIFKSMPKLDAIFVPGGDPGRQEPEVFFKHLPSKVKVLHKYHPNAEVWMSPQGYSAEWMDRFIKIINQKPTWLTGIVHGPWCRMDVDSLRKIIPAKYPIRRYPDITHSIDAQYYVPDWDFAYTVTENRETINPRPLDQQTVFKSADTKNFKGFITYSEGVNDDVNKIVWSSLGWSPNADITEILRDYSRYFIGSDYTDDFAQALFGLERNWRGPLISNVGVYANHAAFQTLESAAPPEVKLNWRFQLALYRSYYDSYTRSRLLYENHLEDKALSLLRQANESGSLQAMKRASEVLNRATSERVSDEWRQRTFELAEALFQSIRMQLSVKKYHAIDTIRGANLDLIDSPLNNRIWLEAQFSRISAMTDENKRLAELAQLTDWENAGPGGFYDDLGNPSNQPHIVVKNDYARDPNSFHTAFAGLPGGYSLEIGRIHSWRTSWKTYMQTIFGLPMEMRYENLDPDAQYEVKVTYVEDVEIRLTANDNISVHDYLMPDFDPKPVTFTIPREATRNGTLSLKWRVDPNGMGPGRGCSVAEVWLMKKR